MLNSSYGKTIEKFHDTTNKIITQTQFNKECGENIKSTQIISGNKFLVEYKQTINQQYNFTQCGTLVLDMSKRIMNEVMCLAEQLDIKIYY